jgi:hypothetical protein
VKKRYRCPECRRRYERALRFRTCGRCRSRAWFRWDQQQIKATSARVRRALGTRHEHGRAEYLAFKRPRVEAMIERLARGEPLFPPRGVPAGPAALHAGAAAIMTRFSNGPAGGVFLELRRAPLFLRVTRNFMGQWDALDQPDDAPSDDEAVYVYRRLGKAGTVHLDYTDRKGRRRGRWLVHAEYAAVEPQPAEAMLRDNAQWRRWATEQVKQDKGRCDVDAAL